MPAYIELSIKLVVCLHHRSNRAIEAKYNGEGHIAYRNIEFVTPNLIKHQGPSHARRDTDAGTHSMRIDIMGCRKTHAPPGNVDWRKDSDKSLGLDQGSACPVCE